MPKGIEYPGAGIGKAEGRARMINKKPNILSPAKVKMSFKVTVALQKNSDLVQRIIWT